MRRSGAAHGFTAIELIIAMAILAIMTAVSVPYFNTMIVTRRLAGATTRVGDDLRLMQSKAVSQGVMHCLHAGTDPAASQPGFYRLQRSTDNGATFTELSGWYSVATDYKWTTLQSVRDNASVAVPRICFNSQGGTVSPVPRPPLAALVVTFPLSLTVANTAGTTKTITVLSTGTVRIPQ
jgi:prepilin-type N-terminal cleavage/methylation domain-containing protein